MKTASCPVCGASDNTELYSREEDLKTARFSFRILRCDNCTHLFSFPLPAIERSGSIYEDANEVFSKDLERANKKIKKWSTSWRNFVLREYLGYKKNPSRNILKYLCGFLLSGFTSHSLLAFHGEGKILDVGCNNGLYLYLLRSLGWQIWGVEIDENACRLAGKLDIDVFCGNLEKAGFAEGFFDVVRFNQVLEHIPDPKKTINEAKKILKEGGRIYISVPNARSLACFLFKEIWLSTGHVQGFSPDSIRWLCKDLGLKIKSMRFNSSRDLLLKGIRHLFKARAKDASLKDGFSRYIVASPLSFILNILHLSDTLTVEVEK